ncbi:MAG: hypothetical protein KIB47_02505 [Clostridium sp.]|nr:hypothetical protein [Clostridium sp.]
MLNKIKKVIILVLSLMMMVFNANYAGNEISFKNNTNLSSKKQNNINSINAVSYKLNSIRYITYADNLNKDSKTMSLYYNYFSI